MNLAIFDLDNTLLDGDSDYLWARFLIDRGIVDGQEYEEKNQYFYDQYKKGTLDIGEFLDFQLQPLGRFPVAQLDAWHHEFMRDYIRPIMLPAARALIAEHKARQHTLLIITATNRFVTAPIAEAFGIEHLLATEVEFKDGRYTGRSTGIPCFQQGKVTRLEQWLTQWPAPPRHSWFYSDSHNDIPLLEKVDTPVVVDGDDTLLAHARRHGWRTISLRTDPAPGDSALPTAPR